MRLTISEIITACGGKIINGRIQETVVTGVSTDSRTITPGDLFVPLSGPRFDGHAYIPLASASQAACALTEQDLPVTDLPDTFILIKVVSTYKALLDLAAYYKGLFAIKTVAVTGSAGKTSTKDMIASVLSQRYNTLKTEGNLNNAIGLPQTVFRLDASYEAAVLEMGMNHFGEIHALSMVAKPDIAVITNIGDAHIENLGSREGILNAKLEILDGLNENGAVILNGDDPLLSSLTDLKSRLRRVIFCRGAVAGEADEVYASEIQPMGLNGTRCAIHVNGQTTKVLVPQPGAHMVMNALMAAAAGVWAGLDMDAIKAGIESFTPSGGRMDIIKANGFTLINDVYNANPASVRAAVDVLAGLQGRRVCVLGDMLELGSYAGQRHEEMGCYAAASGIEIMIAIGTLAEHLYDGYKNGNSCGEAYYFKNKQVFLTAWRDILREGDVVLLKASRGVAFEELVAALGGQN